MIRRPPSSTLFPLHDALPIFRLARFVLRWQTPEHGVAVDSDNFYGPCTADPSYESTATPCSGVCRSEEHTSELQSHSDLVCRLLLEKKKKKTRIPISSLDE